MVPFIAGTCHSTLTSVSEGSRNSRIARKSQIFHPKWGTKRQWINSVCYQIFIQSLHRFSSRSLRQLEFLSSHPVEMSIHSHPSKHSPRVPWGTAWSQWLFLGALLVGPWHWLLASVPVWVWEGTHGVPTAVREVGCCPALPWQFLGWNNSALCMQGLTQDTGRGSQEDSSCSSCCPAQFHPTSLLTNGVPKLLLELAGLCLCPSPTPCVGIHCVTFSPWHLVLLGWQQREVICEHTRLLQCFSSVPCCLCFAGYNQPVTAAFKCKSIGLFFKIVTAGRFFSSRLWH